MTAASRNLPIPIKNMNILSRSKPKLLGRMSAPNRYSVVACRRQDDGDVKHDELPDL